MMNVLSTNQKARITNRRGQIFNWKTKKANLLEAINENKKQIYVWENINNDYDKEIEKLEAEIEGIKDKG